MKTKYFFLAALAGMTLASCSGDDIASNNSSTLGDENSSNGAIVFNSGASATTRANHVGADAAALLGNNLVVEGFKGNGTTKAVVFDHYNVNYVDGTAHTTTSNIAGWEYVAQAKHAHSSVSSQTIKYWDFAESQYDFIAYSKGTAAAIYSGDPTTSQVLYSAIDPSKLSGVDSDNDGKIDQGAYTIKGSAAELAKVYIANMKTAYKAENDYKNTVQFEFRSLSAKIRVALYEIVPGYSINNVVFYTDGNTKATDGKAHLFTTGTDVFNEAGTYVVYYPTTGYSNKTSTDYNKAHLSFIPAASEGTTTDKIYGALDYTNTGADKEGTEATAKYLGRASNDATYAGDNAANYYTVVIPNETGAVLNLKVDYTLTSTDGSGETIKVTGATAQVPAEFATWKSGYAYTYIFKISQNSNGSTDDGTHVGLYPITFDAVVTETEDGIQETITTVAEPSITTYAKGQVVTANNEYTTGKNIYIMVNKAGANVNLTTGTNAKLYTVTIQDGAAQTINEASIANALVNGTPDDPTTPTTWTVRDANGKDMVVTANAGMSNAAQIPASDATDGNAVTINGAVFTPATAGTYVFEFIDTTDGNKKYYKIIKVQ